MNENQNKMRDAESFARKNIAELARLINEWKNTGLLNGGSHCLVHELADMFPYMTNPLGQAENIIGNICIELIANKTDA